MKGMFISKITNAFFLRQKYLEMVFFIFVGVPVAYLLMHGYLFKLTLLCFLGLCVLIAFRLPLFTVFTLIILAILPSVFQTVPRYSEVWMNLGGGIRVPSVIMISMLGAVLLKLFFPAKKKPLQNKLGLSLFVILFGLWISFEIARNIGIYGLSAPGEFRYRYLILSAPLYIAFFFSSAERRKKLLKLLIVSSLFFPIMCVPIIGQLKGWNVGPDSRFFSSSISLGLLYGLLALGLVMKYNVLKINKILYWFIVVYAGLMILIDSHRSVWIATFAAGMTLFWIKKINYSKRMNHTLLAIFSIIIILTLTNQILILQTKTNLVDYITGRASDLVKLDESYNNTAAWRVAQWKAQMTKFYDSPIIGEGFGNYWGLSGMRGDLGVSPHSLYIQSLVKLGTVGLFFYLIIICKIFNKLKRTITKYKFMDDSEMPILILGVVVLIAAHVFYVAYSFEYYSLLFIGLGVACLQDKKFSKYA